MTNPTKEDIAGLVMRMRAVADAEASANPSFAKLWREAADALSAMEKERDDVLAMIALCMPPGLDLPAGTASEQLRAFIDATITRYEERSYKSRREAFEEAAGIAERRDDTFGVVTLTPSESQICHSIADAIRRRAEQEDATSA